MAISTRNKASKKASSRSKATVRPRTSQRNPPTIQVPATPSQGTITPDIIENTQPEPPNDNDRLRELLTQELTKIGQRQPDSQPKAPHDEKSIDRLLQCLLTKAKNKKDDSDSQDSSRVHKSRRRRYRKRYYSSDSSTNSEEEKRPKVSFLHHKKGTHDQALTELTFASPTVIVKYFKQVYYGTFQPENLTRLGQGMADKITNETAQEVKGMVHLSHCMKIYSQIVLQFAHPEKLRKLQLALTKYQIRIAELSITYKFESIRNYNATFVR